MSSIYNDMYRAKLAIKTIHGDNHTEGMRGLNECIVRLEPDSARRISASMQISDYNSAKADFGTELAISTRTELDPERLLDDWIVDTAENDMLENEEVLYNEIEQVDEYENDMVDYEGVNGNAETRNGSVELPGAIITFQLLIKLVISLSYFSHDINLHVTSVYFSLS
ncbi:uncharacterized protein Pyn_20414 [Prunus yedoensis var. nudiflora]|uniref:Uncharacterized protein n=1 Tax=Prunus yedoensis var. nudiflora TaxID=2094558 RepID=A0A314Y5X0_PRUYE|nr:uncharacterized protein Pyn_20414 [Prunus yedoensis var. nudiflora]